MANNEPIRLEDAILLLQGDNKYSKEEQYRQVIQGLVSVAGGERWITRTVFDMPDTLTLEVDDRGCVCFKAAEYPSGARR